MDGWTYLKNRITVTATATATVTVTGGLISTWARWPREFPHTPPLSAIQYV